MYISKVKIDRQVNVEQIYQHCHWMEMEILCWVDNIAMYFRPWKADDALREPVHAWVVRRVYPEYVLLQVCTTPSMK